MHKKKKEPDRQLANV